MGVSTLQQYYKQQGIQTQAGPKAVAPTPAPSSSKSETTAAPATKSAAQSPGDLARALASVGHGIKKVF
jgi:hypothetical protein